MKKRIISFVLALVVGIPFLAVAKDVLLKLAAEQIVTRITGFKTTLSSLHYGIPSTIQIKGLKIENPSEFQERTFVNIPEIYGSLSLSELIQHKRIHLPEVRLNVQEVHIEKNAQGVSNVEKLASVAKQPQKAQAKPTETKKPSMLFQLDRLELTVHQVTYEDRSGILGGKGIPNKIAMDLRLDKEVVTNIASPDILVSIILAKILNGATLGRVLNIDTDQLVKNSLSTAAAQTAALTKQLTNVTGQAVTLINQTEVTKKTEAVLKDSVNGTKEVLGATTGHAKERVTNLFGKVGSLVPQITQEKKK